jgi:hypothetical protein
MVAVARFSRISNATGGVLASAVVNQGQNYSLEVVERVFAAADVGTGAGQTRDATDPAVGCLFAEFFGTKVKAILSAQLMRNATTNTTVFETIILGTDTGIAQLGFNVVTLPSGRIKIYLLDAAVDAGSQIVADDKVRLLVQLGNT